MSQPEAHVFQAAPGRRITLDLAPSPAGPVAAVVRPLTGADELEIGELAGGMLPVELETAILGRGVTLLAGRPPDRAALEALLVGDRNRLLLAVLCAGYGTPDRLLMTCSDPGCGAVHEVAFDVEQVLASAPAVGAIEVIEVAGPDGPIPLRLPTGADLAALAAEAVPADALLKRCVRGSALSAEALQAVEAGIAASDSCTEITLLSRCGDCGAEIAGRVDPLELLRGEMGRWGGALAEFDLLARRYHWSEAELLAMPAHRRRRYVRTAWPGEAGTAMRRAS
jgi:hypothetical protein